MKHNTKVGNLSRTSSHRKAMLANMATSLIIHKRINTTVAKAKALKRYVEPIVTKAKVDSTHARRVAFSYLKDKHAVSELFRVVSPAVGDRPGGYTRILKTGFRLGDAADMCFIELVDFNKTYSQEAADAAKPKTRRGRGAARGGAQQTEETPDTLKAEKTLKTEKAPKAEKALKAEAKETEKAEKAPKVEAKEAVKEEVKKEAKTEETPKAEPVVTEEAKEEEVKPQE